MVNNKKKYSIGLDIGGTKMLGVLWDGDKVVAEYQLATPRESLDKFLVMVNALVEPLAKEVKGEIAGIGLGVAGVIDYDDNRILESPNLAILNGVKLADKIEEMVSLPVKMDNDGNTFLRAEMVLGARRNNVNLCGIVLGTGIGGAWWYNGDIYRAVHGGSGEPGEMIIDFAEGTKLEPAYHQLMQFNPGSVAEEAYRGDVLADKLYEELGDYLGMALANIANLFAPELIIIGGSVSESGDLFLDIAKRVMKENVASQELKKRLKIQKSKVGPQAGAIGAALLIS